MELSPSSAVLREGPPLVDPWQQYRDKILLFCPPFCSGGVGWAASEEMPAALKCSHQILGKSESH